MNFDLTEEEEMLKAAAERFVTDRYNGAGPRRALEHPAGFCADNWALLGEMGLVAMAYTPDSGGLGATPTQIAAVFEALGSGIVVEPLIESALVGGGLFEALAPDSLKADWLNSLVMGTKRVVLAHRETGSRGSATPVNCRAEGPDGAVRLTGDKTMVRAGVGADGFIVSARPGSAQSGSPGGDEGVALYFVAADAAGLTSRAYRLIDGTAACELALHGVPAIPLGGGLESINAVEARANIARCAEALGIMDMLFAVTLEYLRTREQFGVPLGSFQALQHRMVAQYAAIEQARALLYLAIIKGDNDPAAIAGARAYIGTAGVNLGHEMIQMHGGMGVTDELIIGFGHKRLLMLSRYPEGTDAALAAYAGIG